MHDQFTCFLEKSLLDGIFDHFHNLLSSLWNQLYLLDDPVRDALLDDKLGRLHFFYDLRHWYLATSVNALCGAHILNVCSLAGFSLPVASTFEHWTSNGSVVVSSVVLSNHVVSSLDTFDTAWLCFRWAKSREPKAQLMASSRTRHSPDSANRSVFSLLQCLPERRHRHTCVAPL